MPSCVREQNESISACVKSRNPLGIIVFLLLLASAASIYTAYYITNIYQNQNAPTLQPQPLALTEFLATVSRQYWCLRNVTQIAESPLLVTYDNDTAVSPPESLRRESACLRLIVVIPGDYYPVLRKEPEQRRAFPRSMLFYPDTDEFSSSEMVQLTYNIQHNISTSTRYSRDVHVVAYVNINSRHPLPSYIREASKCQFAAEHSAANATAFTSSCDRSAPRFRVNQRLEHGLQTVYVATMDDGRVNIHLMCMSYFLLISAISVVAYGVIRSRNSSKAAHKSKLPQKTSIGVY